MYSEDELTDFEDEGDEEVDTNTADLDSVVLETGICRILSRMTKKAQTKPDDQVAANTRDLQMADVTLMRELHRRPFVIPSTEFALIATKIFHK